MKIKLFEEFTEYNIGDYVLLSGDCTVSVDVAKIYNKKINPLQFLIETFYLESGRKWNVWVNYSEIKNKISFEEYKEIKRRNFIEYKLRKDTNKYNL